MPADRLLHPRAGRSHKVTILTDLEYRVWTQYLLSADDFGVMHATSHALQNDNLHLANRPAKMIRRCLEALIKAELVLAFEHQGQPYVFQHDWQKWQKVEYPRTTINPCPPADALALCDDVTRELFEKHPGGQRKGVRPKDVPNDSARASRIQPEDIPPTRASAPAERLTANGERLMANGSEGELRETPPMDVWLREFQAQYPQHRVTRNHRTEQVFVNALLSATGGPSTGWTLMLANLALNLASHEWRVKRMIPSLEKYLADGLWLNVLPADPSAAEQLSPRTMRMLS